MSSPEIFERVRTSVEKRNIFEALARANGSMICKEGDDSLFSFQVKVFLESMGLLGVKNVLTVEPKLDQSIIANFQVDQHRYFLEGKLIQERKGHFLFVPGEDLFLLQRRAHVRIGLPDTLERNVNIIAHNGKSVFLPAQVSDVSMGGSRIECAGSARKFVNGDRIRIVFHIRNKWLIDLQAEVRHARTDQDRATLGVRFLEADQPTTHKLTMMVLELQKMFLLG